MRTLWIDADASSKKARRIAIRAALRHRIRVVFVSNHDLNIRPSEDIVSIRVEAGKDVADNYILAEAHPNDVVVTRDILLAKKLLRKDMRVMNDFGVVFHKESIEGKIIERHAIQEIRDAVGQRRTKSKTDFSRPFAQSLEKLLSQ